MKNHERRELVNTLTKIIGGIFWHSNQKMAAAYWMPLPVPPNAKVSGAGTASAGLPGWQANGETE